jgi:DedD protein
MNSLLDDDEAVEREHHEVTLSTGTILGIFFGLVLLCGLFFGFGYKMGSHRVTATGQPVVAENATAPATNFGSFKPAAGSPADGSGAATAASAATAAPTTRAERREEARLEKKEAKEAAAAAEHGPPTAGAAAAPAAATGAFVVQVAAVSHQEDSELLVNALRAKGYPVSAHTEPQDKFFHIQVGPFSTRKDADAAKQKLLADGYQPIVK